MSIADSGTLTPVESEKALHTLSQRRVNMTWELTQATIAVGVTIGTIYAALIGLSSPVLSNAFFLVIGFYFGRTNHTNVGGVTDVR